MNQYLCLIEKNKKGSKIYFSGFCYDLPVFVVSKPTKEAVIESLREGLALAFLHLEGERKPIPKSKTKEGKKESSSDEFVWLEPAPVNPVSLEVEDFIKSLGISQAEAARRIGTSRAALNRLTNPFYWGHNISSLRQITETLGGKVEVKLYPTASRSSKPLKHQQTRV
jgi:antitoxin HicB